MNRLYSLVKTPTGWHLAVAENGRLSHVAPGFDPANVGEAITHLLARQEVQDAPVGSAIDVTVIVQPAGA